MGQKISAVFEESTTTERSPGRDRSVSGFFQEEVNEVAVGTGLPARISLPGLAALFMVNFGYMADLAVIPAAESIYKAFPNAPMFVLNFILTGPQLVAIFSALLVSVFMHHVCKKDLIIFFFSLFTISACFGAAIQNVYYMAVMRAVVGFAEGALLPLGIALINEIYHGDESRCSKLIGYFSACMTLTGCVMSLVAGFLCVSHWSHVFDEYRAAIPMLLLMIFFIPRTPPEKIPLPQIPGDSAAEKEPFPFGRVIALLMSFTLIGLTVCLMTYLNSVYLEETGLGNATFSAVLTSVGTIAAALAGLSFGAVYTRFKRGTIIFSYLLLFIGFLCASFVFSKAWMFVSMIILSFGYGLAVPYFYEHITRVVPYSHSSQCIGFVTAAFGLGAFLSSYILTVFEMTTGLHIVALCRVYVAVTLIALLLSIYLTKRDKKQYKPAMKNT